MGAGQQVGATMTTLVRHRRHGFEHGPCGFDD